MPVNQTVFSATDTADRISIRLVTEVVGIVTKLSQIQVKGDGLEIRIDGTVETIVRVVFGKVNSLVASGVPLTGSVLVMDGENGQIVDRVPLVVFDLDGTSVHSPQVGVQGTEGTTLLTPVSGRVYMTVR